MVKYGCSVKDRAAAVYGQPFFVPSRAVAVRSFADEVNRAAEDNQLYKHADDFDLYCVCMFEDGTGLMLECVLEILARGKDLVKPA